MRTVFVDVDTQFDFILPAGALYAPGAEKALPVVGALNQYAAVNGTTVISTTDAHSENDPEFRQWPPHCVAGTLGQQKPASTLLEKRVVVPSCAVQSSIGNAQQIIIEKQHVDAFTNPNLIGILRELGAERYVVYGLVTDVCVRYAAEGLLKLGRRVELVEDAIRALDEGAGRAFLRAFAVAGGIVTSAAAVMGGEY